MDESNPSCCFEPISIDLKNRLEIAQKQITDLTFQNSALSQELSKKNQEIEKLRFEKNQIITEKSNAIDHLTIIKAKSDILKSDIKKRKEENENLNKTVANLEQKNKEMSDLLIKASERLKKNKIQLSELNKQNEKIINDASSSDQETIQKCQVQLAQYANVIREQEDQIQILLKKKSEQKAKIKELIRLQNDNQSKSTTANSPSSEITQLKLKIQKMEIENKMLQHQNESLQTVLKKYNEIESDNITLHETTNRLENEVKQLQKLLDKSNERFKELSRPNNNSNNFCTEEELYVFKEKASHADEIEKENQNLLDEIKKLSSEIKVLQLNNSKLSDKINDLNYVALEHEKIKKDVLKCEVEIQEKEIKEQSLLKKYHYYKEKTKKQLQIINNFESKTNEINLELDRLRERESQKEAALRRKNRSKTANEENVVKLSRELYEEKAKNVRLNSRLQKKQLQDINSSNP